MTNSINIMPTTDTMRDIASQLSETERQELIARWQEVKQHISHNAANRQPVTLLAVSKTKPSSMIATLAAQGQRDFGENYVQEAIDKITQLTNVTAQGQALIWHYIGHIQRNKTRDLAQYFDWVHGVDRLIIAQRLSEQRPNTLAPLNICIQVNIDDESSKSGCQPEELPVLIAQISQLSQLRLRGLMIIPAKDSQTAFARTKQLFEDNKIYHAHSQDWDTLSMGMSSDSDVAINAGATIVRIGTAIFGTRDYANS